MHICVFLQKNYIHIKDEKLLINKMKFGKNLALKKI